jgi:hypothetical protein
MAVPFLNGLPVGGDMLSYNLSTLETYDTSLGQPSLLLEGSGWHEQQVFYAARLLPQETHVRHATDAAAAALRQRPRAHPKGRQGSCKLAMSAVLASSPCELLSCECMISRCLLAPAAEIILPPNPAIMAVVQPVHPAGGLTVGSCLQLKMRYH